MEKTVNDFDTPLFHKLNLSDISGWVFNEGGRFVVEWMRIKNRTKAYSFRVFIFGVNFRVYKRWW